MSHPLSDPIACGNVWHVIYQRHDLPGDVAIPASRRHHLEEWDDARERAVRNAQYAKAEAQRWQDIVAELDRLRPDDLELGPEYQKRQDLKNEIDRLQADPRPWRIHGEGEGQTS